jgi:hypothetical protein
MRQGFDFLLELENIFGIVKISFSSFSEIEFRGVKSTSRSTGVTEFASTT